MSKDVVPGRVYNLDGLFSRLYERSQGKEVIVSKSSPVDKHLKSRLQD